MTHSPRPTRSRLRSCAHDRRLTLALGIAALTVPASLTAAQVASAAGAPSTPLRGPDVGPREGAAPTLVQRSFDGRLHRLEVDPAVAALDVIEIGDDARARVLAILDARAAALDRVVIDNIDVLTQIEGAAEGGMVLRLLHLASQIRNEFTKVAGDEAVVDQLAGVLPSEQARRMRALVDEYWNALVEEECGGDAGRIERFIAERRAHLELFGKEVERSVERVFEDDEEGAEFEALLAQLDLTSEQRVAIDGHVADFVRQTRMTPTKQEEVDLLMRIYGELGTEQRTKLFELVISMEG